MSLLRFHEVRLRGLDGLAASKALVDTFLINIFRPSSPYQPIDQDAGALPKDGL